MKKNIVAVLTYPNIQQQLKLLRYYLKYISAIELRIDTFWPHNIKKIPILLFQLRRSFPQKAIIVTFRFYKEGGKLKISETQRLKVISEIVSQYHKFINYIDIEYFSLIYKDVLKLAQRYNLKTIVSWHLLTKTTKVNFIKKITKLKPLQNKKNLFIKIVVNEPEFNSYFEKLRLIFKKFKTFKKLTFFTIGNTSLFSRIIGYILEMPFIYAASQKPVITTQPSIKSLIKIFKKMGLIV